MKIYNIVFWPKIDEFRYFVVLRCGSYHTIKNGSTHNGKPKRQCDIDTFSTPTNSDTSLGLSSFKRLFVTWYSSIGGINRLNLYMARSLID
jgi:hypothetical protein